ncbi:glycosyl transferase family 2 [Cyanosarcina cf. burmensis CCALA 770]|nr:glycosyl transferase family 2 [Cyanosarcina cf. burmensis CCALA 770]
MNVSAIVPAYNAAATISKTLESLFAQSFPHWEAIIVNDGSSDDTLAIATQFAERDSRIRVVSQSQTGVSAARNTGIKEAKYDWLLFLDADDWILPPHLERLIQAVERAPNLDAVYSGWARVTPDGSLLFEQCVWQPDSIFEALARNNVFVIHSCIVRRSLVTSVGGFDPSFRTCEDWDLWQRIARTGARFGSIPDALARYLMRSDSATTSMQQLLKDGLRVIETGHSPDPRVQNPAPAYAEGMLAAVAGAKLDYVCWTAGLVLGHNGDPLTLLGSVQQERYPGLKPELLAQYLFKAPLFPTCRSLTDWTELWQHWEGKIREFLQALEAQSQAPALSRRVCQQLENLILEHSIAPQPLTIGSTYAVGVEVTEPILDVTAPATAERLHCAVEIAGKHLGAILLPICDGCVPSCVLKDAIAAKFAWSILSHFFDRTVYRQLTVKRSSGGSSLWRGSVCLAEGLPDDERELWSMAHDRIGWTVFLQELWNRPHWSEQDLYNLQTRKLLSQEIKLSINSLRSGKVVLPTTLTSIFLRSQAKDGWIAIEVTEELPNVSVNSQELLVIPLVGGVPVGIVPVKVKDRQVSVQQLRTAITEAGGLELAVVAVREGLLGKSIDEANLRDRLAQNQAEFSLWNSESKPAKFPLQNYGSDRAVVLARHQGAIGTSSCRRAILPQAATNDLIEAASVAGEPVIKVPSISDRSERVVYAPDLIWLPAQTAISTPIALKSPLHKSRAENLRADFETLFAKQADPWKYTSPYEQKKYEQTLELLPSTRLEQVLEIACAEGHFTIQLAPRVGSLLAADISQLALERTAERCAGLENVRFQQFDLTKDPIGDRFDLIICSEVLYYIGGLDRLQAFARKVADALNPGGYFLTAHANLVVDEPDRPGYNWDHPFGAKVIGETFANTSRLQLIKELHTPLYRIQLFQATDDPENASPRIPEILELPQPTPPPSEVAEHVLWHGGSPQRWGDWKVTTERLPILMYHRVAPDGSPATSRYRVTPQAFAEQLRYLHDAGFYSVTLDDWYAAMATKTALPGRAVLITFDDGYQDFLTYAQPVLKQYGFSATVFLVADRIGQTNCWDSFYGEDLPLLSWEEIRQLQAEGVEFGSHTASHRPLTGLSLAEVVSEAARSRTILQQGLGHSPKAFAYPYGDTDPVVQHLIGACGYVFGLSCKPGLSSFHDSLLALSRIEITGTDSLRDFVAKVSQ